MAAPGWLSTEPDPVKLPNRIRPGWAPKPGPKVKLVRGWEVPAEARTGAGQDEQESPGFGYDPSALGPRVPLDLGPAGELNPGVPSGLSAAPPTSLTTEPDPATTVPEAGASDQPPAAPASTGSVLSSSKPAASPSVAAPTGVAKSGAAASAAPPPQGPSSAPRPTGTATAFIDQHLAEAKRVAAKTGIPYQLLLAIPGNETGWGSAVAGNNYFGIKGTNPKSGANTGPTKTWEVVNGQRVDINDTFRAYGGFEESAEDFAQFLKDNPRYSKALDYLRTQPDDWRGFVRKVHDAGYATDPEWSNKIIRTGSQVESAPSAPTSGPSVSRTSPDRVSPDRATGRQGVQSVINVGRTAVGSKYVWGGPGGRSDFNEQFAGSDCSGFVAWAYQRATGRKLPAQTQSIWGATRGIGAEDAAPGDLVMYNMNTGDPHLQHVGIYMGNGMMLHDSSINPNGGVDITPLWEGAQFRRVDGVDPELTSYGDNRVAEVRARVRRNLQRADEMSSGPGWEAFVPESGFTPEEEFRPDTVGAGQEGLTAGGGGGGREDEGEDTDYSFLDTPLSPQGEAAFQIWKAKYAPRDSGFDYDLRGAYSAGLSPDPQSGHWPDTYKKPNHPTFSDQSKFAKQYPHKAGRWDGEQYIPPVGAGQEGFTAGGGGGGAEDAGSSLSKLIQPDVGKPYVFGAAHSPTNDPVSAHPGEHEAYDCSSFVSSVAARQGYQLTPFTDRMYDETAPVEPGQETAGDLIFYQYNDPSQKGVKFPHVGIYAGNGRTLEARYDPKTGGGVGEYDQLDPNRFKPVFRRMTKPMGAGQEGFTDGGGGGYAVAETDEQRRLREEQEALQRQEIVDAQKRQAQAEQTAATPEPNIFERAGKAVDDYSDWVGEKLHPASGKSLSDLITGDQPKPPEPEPPSLIPTAGGPKPEQAVERLEPGTPGGPPKFPTAEEYTRSRVKLESEQTDTGAAVKEAVRTVSPGTYVGRAYEGTFGEVRRDPEIQRLGDELNQAQLRGDGPETERLTREYDDRYHAILGGLDWSPGAINERALASPDVETAEMGGNLVMSGAAAALAPAGLASGTPEFLGSLALDPAGAPYSVGGEAVIQGAKAIKSAVVASRAATAAQDARAATVAAEPAMAQAVALASDPTVIAQGATNEVVKDARRGAELLGVLPDTHAAADDAAKKLGAMKDAAEEWGVPIGPEMMETKTGWAEMANQEQVDQLVSDTMRLSAPEKAGIDTGVARALTQPLTPQQEMDILQQAALHLNADEPMAAAAQLQRAEQRGEHMETLTGAQMRRYLVNTVAEKYPMLSPEEVLEQTDRILADGGGHALTHGVAEEAGVVPPDELFEVGNLWSKSDLAAEAARVHAERAAATAASMAKEAYGGAAAAAADGGKWGGRIGQVAGRVAAGVPGGIGGYLAGVADEKRDREQDPNRDNYPPWRYIGAAAGFGVSAAAAPWIGAFVSKNWTPKALNGIREIMKPVENTSPEFQAIYAEWAGHMNQARALGQQFRDQILAAWPKADSQLLQQIELTGDLPAKLRTSPEAVAVLERWRGIAAWARKYEIIPDAISETGKAKQYVPHVLDAAWKEAWQSMKQVSLGAYDTGPNTRQVATNPFWQYTKPRTHETMADAVAESLKAHPDNPIKYTDDVAGVLSLYYQRAIERLAMDKLVNDMQALGRKNDPEFLKRLRDAGEGMLAKEGVAIIPKGEDLLVKNGKQLTDLPGFRFAKGMEDVWVHPDIHSVFKNVMGDETRWTRNYLVQPFFALQNAFRQSVLSGADVYQALWGSTGLMGAHGTALAESLGKEGVGKLLRGDLSMLRQGSKSLDDGLEALSQGWHFMFSPAAHRKWLNNPENLQRMARALGDNVTLTLGDQPNDLGLKAQLFNTMVMPFVTGGLTAGGTLATGGTPEEAAQNALKVGAVTAGVSLPIFGNRYKAGVTLPQGTSIGIGKWGKEGQRGLIEEVTKGIWERALPFWKLQTYEMYKELGKDGQAAAQITNDIFGGQNLLAVARSRNVQDTLRMFAMTPDFQEGFLNTVGNSLFNWGKETPRGDMSRIFWASTMVQSAVALELMNLAFGGHWSWQNPPDKVLAVDTSRLAQVARDHGVDWPANDQQGQPLERYVDVLGPIRGLTEGTLETSRWLLASAYDASGVQTEDLPPAVQAGVRAVRGDWPNIPKPDPATKWLNFVKARGGLVPTLGTEVLANKDFYGRPLNREEDPEYQQVLNRVASAAEHWFPSGISDISRGMSRGDPLPLTIFQYATGHRVERETPATRQADDFNEWLQAAGKSADEWRQVRTKARAHNEQIDQTMEAVQAGTGANADLTARQRTNILNDQGAQRQSVFKDRYDMLAGIPEGPKKDQLRAQLQELQKYDTFAGTGQRSDLQDRSDLDIDELVRMAWDRDPDEIARLKGTFPQQQGLEGLKEGALSTLRKLEPGYDEQLALSRLRNRWLGETATKYGIDPAVLQDLVKAHVYQQADDQGGYSPPVLEGVSSEELDHIVDRYQAQSMLPDGKPNPNAQEVSDKRTAQLLHEAQQHSVDPLALQQRVKLRMMPAVDSTPAAVERSHALDVRNQARDWKYMNPDGTPMGGPDEWKLADGRLDAAKSRFNFKETDGQGYYYNRDGSVDQELTGLLRAKERASAIRQRDVLNSEHAEDYYRWFGDGANMTDAQWQAYQQGTLDMWHDQPSPREAQNRKEAMRLWAALSPEERRVYGVPNVAGGSPPISYQGINEYGEMRRRGGSLQEYIAYINAYKQKRYADDGSPLLGDIDPGPPVELSSGG